MSRQETYADIKEALGIVPGFFDSMPEDSLASEWALFRRYVLDEVGAIPPKYRELIGIGAAAAKSCWYCANFHTGVATLNGATEEEIQEAVHLAKFGAGWSAYLSGISYDHDRFLKELGEVGAYVRSSS
jgi:AhpD family alkylhydroperoxidase